METQYFAATNETIQHYTDQALSAGFCSRLFGVKAPQQTLYAHPVGREGESVTDQTDRIKQMAQEAGIQPPWVYDGRSQDTPWMADTADLAKFAALVAEDCARVVADETNAAMDQWGLGMDAYHASERAEQAIRARYAIAKPPEAG